jgi:hypothetical protein
MHREDCLAVDRRAIVESTNRLDGGAGLPLVEGTRWP